MTPCRTDQERPRASLRRCRVNEKAGEPSPSTNQCWYCHSTRPVSCEHGSMGVRAGGTAAVLSTTTNNTSIDKRPKKPCFAGARHQPIDRPPPGESSPPSGGCSSMGRSRSRRAAKETRRWDRVGTARRPRRRWAVGPEPTVSSVPVAWKEQAHGTAEHTNRGFARARRLGSCRNGAEQAESASTAREREGCARA